VPSSAVACATMRSRWSGVRGMFLPKAAPCEIFELRLSQPAGQLLNGDLREQAVVVLDGLGCQPFSRHPVDPFGDHVPAEQMQGSAADLLGVDASAEVVGVPSGTGLHCSGAIRRNSYGLSPPRLASICTLEPNPRVRDLVYPQVRDVSGGGEGHIRWGD
jgi:hypothetical protein